MYYQISEIQTTQCLRYSIRKVMKLLINEIKLSFKSNKIRTLQ